MDKLVTLTPFLPKSHHHGGRLQEAADRFQIPIEQWLDLSTGINPNGWQPAEIPRECWARLPETDDGLEAAASNYYGCNQLLMTAGSQAVLQTLPRLRQQTVTVGIFSPSYYEHEAAWEKAGHRIIHYTSTPPSIDDIDVLIVVNPNNPTGQKVDITQLLHWHEALSAKGGWLVVDEAFMDADNAQSLLPFCPQAGLIVLRSLGKFFGLAGIRCGAVFAEHQLLQQLDDALGPWTLSNPTRWVATQALSDSEWQHKNVVQLQSAAAGLEKLLGCFFDKPSNGAATGTTLFQTVKHKNADDIFVKLAKEGILVRLFSEQQLIRFGLPSDNKDLLRLEKTLQRIL